MQISAKLKTTEDALAEDTLNVSQQMMQDPAQLVAAFEQFGRLSDQLQQSYQELDGRAEELTRQLASAQNERLQQLAEKEQLAHHLESLLNALPAGVLLIDEQGVINTANPAAELFLEQSLIGEKWREIYAKQVSRHTEQDLHLNSGRILSLKKQPLVTSDIQHNKNQSAEIILLDDITEQRMLEGLADRQERLAAMGQMAAGLAHQLRTPLASAVLYASQLKQISKDNLACDPRQNKALDKIQTCMRYLEKLINDMLMYAKGGEFAEQKFQLNDLLVTFNTRIETNLRDSHTQLKIISQLEDTQMTGSLDALASVLINLVENAIQACDERCEIELEVYQQAGYLILAVKDNGPGLSSEEQAKVFQPFFTQREGGTGLGLAVAQSIVQAHHGDLLVRSQIKNGCRFLICLPLNRGEQFLASGQKSKFNPDKIL